MPLAASLAAEKSAANQDIPIFMAHGRYDELIPLHRAQTSRDFLQKLGYKVEWHDYPMAHSVCADEIVDIRRFLEGVLE